MNDQPIRRQAGDLEILEVKGKPGRPTIVLFHGYGADAYDLLPLHRVFPAAEGANWVFPQAPLHVDIGFGMTGRAWFPIDVAALEAHLQAGTHRDMSGLVPDGFAQARTAVQSMLAALGVASEQLILGGFSQGSMLATDLVLRAEKSVRGLIILSGTLLNEAEWRSLAPKRAGLPFFQSHGTADPLLAYHAAERLNALLNEAGLLGKLVSFNGGHEIPQEVVFLLNGYLAERLKDDLSSSPRKSV